ncbi:Protein-methionine-sulfoxide reductase heme-binding subunit MsrQ [Sulfitobacter sp. DSM 110093]|uniref:protein-methionine-sulfoxide reductase heme-binding subunit MsrQ n=1 Tax=Sulfitobacter sp. DSM 110093 TaxID=2883127 RepID=UPI001FAE6AC4|nr:protein-methionine-sulfoxide reductase heme-binding subunit MsrQ [Sulfitobacter sp. DSM 110093]UOA30780.1 Protein-methionine-sulfoxide reductase heme-binding subunit MsrQ [Sulfitobacter sp. DSM 110093]
MAGLINSLNGLARRVPVWSVYLLLALPIPWFFYQGLNGGLGRDPVKALEHVYGLWALRLLIVGLAITPLRRTTGINLLRFRRAVGVMTFVYVLAHLMVWAVLDVQALSRVWADVLKRPYITIGMAGFLCLVPLAATSNNWSLRKLGARWRKLHRLAYVAALLAGLHFLWLAKGFQLEPLVYAGLILALLIYRLPHKRIFRRFSQAG